jgi:hypothetical protein
MPENTTPQPKEATTQPVQNNVKYVMITYNLLGFVTGFYLIADDSKNSYLVTLMWPLLGVVLCLFSRGKIKFLVYARQYFSGSIYIGFLFPALFMLFESCDDFTVLNNGHLWLPFLGISLVLMVVLYFTGINPFDERKRLNALFVFALVLAYGYGGTRAFNCAFDTSDPQVYNTTVIRQHKETGKHTSYYLTIDQWGPMSKASTQEVDKKVYERTKIGDTVKVNLRKGRLDIPWFVVAK